jgi:hypothetical protein
MVMKAGNQSYIILHEIGGAVVSIPRCARDVSRDDMRGAAAISFRHVAGKLQAVTERTASACCNLSSSFFSFSRTNLTNSPFLKHQLAISRKIFSAGFFSKLNN